MTPLAHKLCSIKKIKIHKNKKNTKYIATDGENVHI